MCGGQMRLIAFITEGTQIRKILDHIGVDSEPPHTSPARGPPLWDDCDAQMDDGVHIEPADWDLAAQPASDYEVDQRINWRTGWTWGFAKTVTQPSWRVAMRPAYPAHR